MKKAKLYYSLPLLTGIALTGCNGLNKMVKNAPLVKYEVTPNPLELRGDSVAISIKATYPVKYFGKKVVATVTPYIKTSTGEKDFKDVTVDGEKVVNATNKVDYKTGGSVIYTDKIAYTPDMKVSDVMIKAKGTVGKTSKDIPATKIADATIVTQQLVKADEKPIMAPDSFKKVIPVPFNSNIFYPINNANVNAALKNKKAGLSNPDEMKSMSDFIKDGMGRAYTFTGANIMAYASPDGPMPLNEKLATNRGASSNKYLKDAMKKMKLSDSTMNFYNVNHVAEDWDGLKALLQASNMTQKDMIIRIVESNSGDARTHEMKNMGKAFTEIAETMLPKLRRSRVTINAEKRSRTDEQILTLAKSTPDSLDSEELLYGVGNLTQDNALRMTIYKTAAAKYPNDWRAANNLGATQIIAKDAASAKANFEKANSLSANNPVVLNNLGAVAALGSDWKKAADYYNQAKGAGKEVNENIAILDIMHGDYSSAVSNYGDSKEFNAALAQLLNGDKDGSLATLNASPDASTGIGYYLKAVIAARKGDKSGALSNLKSAISADATFRTWAKEDREFIKFQSDVNSL